MLVIREAQLQVFRDLSRQRFEQRLKQYVREALVAAGIAFTEEVLQDQIELGMKNARELGLIAERDVARYIAIVCSVLAGFTPESHPRPALHILRAPGQEPREKLDRFEEWARAYRREVMEEDPGA
jgi:hypothetical protein